MYAKSGTFLGPNAKAGYFLRCPSSILILLSTVLGAQEAGILREKTNLWRC